jgi:hypothetical protein
MQALRATEFEGEPEFEDELEIEFEGEYEGEGEEFLGTIARGIGGLLGQSEYEYEAEDELDGEYEDEGEEFFRRIGGFLRRAAPVLRNVARVAAPIVGTAVGGPLGGMLGRVAAGALREEELEGEFEYEAEDELELEDEYEDEDEAAPITPSQALAELMAAVASQAQTEEEAEAMAGAATLMTISAADRSDLRRILPNLVRGTAILTRILRRRRVTRPAVRAVPTIVRRTSRVLAQRAAGGQPVTKRAAGRVMAAQTNRVLGDPRTCASAVRRNVRATQAAQRATPAMARPRRQPIR